MDDNFRCIVASEYDPGAALPMLVVDVDVAIDQAVESIDAGIVVLTVAES